MDCDKRECKERGEGGENMSEKETSENYEMVEFVKGLYRASYDNLCVAKMTSIPLREYVGEADEVKYYLLLNECLYKVEELSDMLWMLEEKMMKNWMYEGKEGDE